MLFSLSQFGRGAGLALKFIGLDSRKGFFSTNPLNIPLVHGEGSNYFQFSSLTPGSISEHLTEKSASLPALKKTLLFFR
jgi:hypothetical protein